MGTFDNYILKQGHGIIGVHLIVSQEAQCRIQIPLESVSNKWPESSKIRWQSHSFILPGSSPSNIEAGFKHCVSVDFHCSSSKNSICTVSQVAYESKATHSNECSHSPNVLELHVIYIVVAQIFGGCK